MSKEMLELADEIEKLARLDAQAGVGALCARNDAAIVAALRASAVAEPVAWQDDPAADERWNAGVDFVMKLLCDYLCVEHSSVTWDAATETVEGDVSAVIGNILRAKFGDDWGPHAHPAPAAPVPDQCAKCGQPHKEHTYNGACYGVCGEFVSATASLPAPEAAPTREEIDATRLDLSPGVHRR